MNKPKIPTLKSLSKDNTQVHEDKKDEEAASDNNGFFTPNNKIDFFNVKIEPLFEEEVDFDTFSKSDFRAVKVKACEAVPKSKKLFEVRSGRRNRHRSHYSLRNSCLL